MYGAYMNKYLSIDLTSREITQGKLDPKKECVTCSGCTQIMRDHGRTGCIIREREVYGPIYKECRRLMLDT